MFENVLVAVDFTAGSADAVRVAGRLAAGGDVTLLHVIERIEGLGHQELAGFYRKLEARARGRLRALAAKLGRTARARQTILYGKRAETIVKHAIDEGHDLIVLGSRRVDLKGPAPVWGGVSHRVAILAQCPVLLVK